MKQFLYLAIVLPLVVLNNGQSQMAHDEAEKFLGYVAVCKNETGATDTDVEDMYNRNIPTTKTGKCFNECLFNKLGIFKDGKLTQDGLAKILEMDKSDLKGKDGKTLLESIKDITGECMGVADSDKCEYAAKIRICLNAAAKKREFCPNVF